MTDKHRATPEQWAAVEEYAKDLNSGPACLLELRARVEALEARQEIRSGPESLLVERVADAIAAEATSAGIVDNRPARAAIAETADWLTENGWASAAVKLRRAAAPYWEA